MNKRLFTVIVVFLSCVIVGLIVVLSIELLKDNSDNSGTTIADGYTEYVPTVTPVPAPVYPQANPDDIPEDTEWIEYTPAEEYPESNNVGDIEWNKLEYCKHDMVLADSIYDWAFDIAGVDFEWAQLLSNLNATYVKENGVVTTVKYVYPSELGIDTYFDNAAYYILNLDGVNVMFIVSDNQDVVYFDKYDNLVKMLTK